MTYSKAVTIKQPQSGFTLIEVLVTLVIVAVSIPPLLSQISTSVDGLGYSEQKLAAQWVASNQAAQLQIDNRQTGAVPSGRGSGEEKMMGLEWSWTTEAREIPGVIGEGIIVVEINVYAEEDSDKESALATHYAYLFDENNSGPNLAALAAAEKKDDEDANEQNANNQNPSNNNQTPPTPNTPAGGNP